MICPECKGDGFKLEPYGSVKCKNCNGTGEVMNIDDLFKPIEIFSNQDGDGNTKFKHTAVREIEANYKEAIKALIDDIISYEFSPGDLFGISCYKRNIKIVEKALGEPWEKIKKYI